MHYSALVIGDFPEARISKYSDECDSEKVFEIEYTKKDLDGLDEERIAEIKEDYIRDSKGNYWCLYSPNTLYDWNEIGGRWAWFFILKDEVPSDKYPPVSFSWDWDEKEKQEQLKYKVSDQAQIQDIDFDKMLTRYKEVTGDNEATISDVFMFYYCIDDQTFYEVTEDKDFYNDYIKDLDPETLLTVYDFHN